VLAKTTVADVGEGAFEAFKAGYSDIFEMLIVNERCLEASGTPLVTILFGALEKAQQAREARPLLHEQQRSMMETFLRKWPPSATTPLFFSGLVMRPLECAVFLRDAGLVKLILEVTGACLQYEEKEETIDGDRIRTYSTLGIALTNPCAEVLRLLESAGAFA
jgi:hypothetical protein